MVTQGFVAVEADYEGVERARRSGAASTAEADGIVLDDAVFAVRAAVEALAQFPELNASISGAGVEAHPDRNIGVAIDVEGRLLVPVIAGAQDLNLRGLSRRLGELLGRAQAGELAVDDLLGGTFTVAAAPSERVLVSIPGLIEPQVAILSVGGVRPDGRWSSPMSWASTRSPFGRWACSVWASTYASSTPPSPPAS